MELIKSLDINIDEDLLSQMDKIRDLSTQALKIRQEKGVKVRQPLNALIIKNSFDVDDGVLEILKDEINVKNVVFDNTVSDDLDLDVNLTEELVNEGKYRELTRLVQELRRESNYSPNDLVDLSIIVDNISGF
ncbi:MAG: DUF5915 domain-containing protein [Candidatus Pacebacteria bacterium]|nr:DUF5915 domain-containing protein [Candidatus Paceibacterota bacterium]